MFSVRCGGREGKLKSKDFNFDVAVSDEVDDGLSDNGADKDDSEENEDGNNGNDVVFVVIDVDADPKSTEGKEAVNDNCSKKVGEEGFGAAAGLIVAVLIFVVDDDDDDDDHDVHNNVVRIRNGSRTVVDGNNDKGNDSDSTVDLNFDCLDDKGHSRNGDVDASDTDVTGECDIGCTRDCWLNNKAFVTENVTVNDKVTGVG